MKEEEGDEEAAAATRRSRGVGAVVEVRSMAAATGWSHFCEEEVVDTGLAGTQEGPLVSELQQPVAPAATTPAAGAPETSFGPSVCTLPDGAMPFYFLDAYEPVDSKSGKGASTGLPACARMGCATVRMSVVCSSCVQVN